MIKEFNLEFCFKGSRKYVHGTDIFTKISEQYSDSIKNIDIAFYGITVNNMTFYKEKAEKEEVKVTFRCQDDENKVKLFGIENDVNIDCRYEYIEEKIVNNSSVDIPAESIILNTPTEYSFIEHIVAMNKALVEKIYSDIDGKWYFTRLQLQTNINMSDITDLQLILKSNFQFKLTKSAIMIDNNEVGFIYFSLIPKEP